MQDRAARATNFGTKTGRGLHLEDFPGYVCHLDEVALNAQTCKINKAYIEPLDFVVHVGDPAPLQSFDKTLCQSTQRVVELIADSDCDVTSKNNDDDIVFDEYSRKISKLSLMKRRQKCSSNTFNDQENGNEKECPRLDRWNNKSYMEPPYVEKVEFDRMYSLKYANSITVEKGKSDEVKVRQKSDTKKNSTDSLLQLSVNPDKNEPDLDEMLLNLSHGKTIKHNKDLHQTCGSKFKGLTNAKPSRSKTDTGEESSKIQKETERVFVDVSDTDTDLLLQSYSNQ